MKKLILLIFGLFSLSGSGQTQDTIFANENLNVALFFPEKIRQAVVGAENFVFSYNQEHPQFFGLLKGSAGKNSNLLAITHDGEIYSYILKYKEDLPRVTYFLNKAGSLGNERPGVVGEEEKIVSTSIKSLDSVQRITYLEELSAHYSNNCSGKITGTRKNGIVLQVNEMIYYKDDVFIIFEIANRSAIEFEPEYLRLFLSRGNRRRNASHQKLLQEPLLKFKFPENIMPGQRKRFVYVLSKFTIGENEKLVVELREKNGNRAVYLKFKK